MFYTIANVLNADALERIRVHIGKLDWKDGAETAGHAAKGVKRNLQAVMNTQDGQRVQTAIHASIMSNLVFKTAARPAKISPLLISRTGVEGGYGAHVDNALMGTGAGRLRTDLSYTLFLSDPGDYEGGELMLDVPGGAQGLKPVAGDLVLYPSTLIHQVAPVRAGERLAAVGWVQSEVRDAGRRQILFDLEQVRVAQRARTEMDAPERLMLDKVFSNLLREWTEL